MKIISIIALSLLIIIQFIAVQSVDVKKINYVDTSTSLKILQDLAVPGIYNGQDYQYLYLDAWNPMNGGVVNILSIWEKPKDYFNEKMKKILGNTNQKIRTSLKKIYNDHNKKIFVILFGKDGIIKNQMKSGIEQGQKLSKFINQYNLDGVVVDSKDLSYFARKTTQYARRWVNEFLGTLRFRLPTKLIVNHWGYKVATGGNITLKRISVIPDYTSPDKILEGLGAPTYDTTSVYDYLCIDSWNSQWGAVTILRVWQTPVHFLGNKLGNSNQQSQKQLQQLYHNHGKKVLAFAFGQNNVPTFLQKDPAQVAQKLADFVKNNYLDGAVIDYQDLYAEVQKTQVTDKQWLSKFLSNLHKIMKDKIIVDNLGNPI